MQHTLLPIVLMTALALVGCKSSDHIKGPKTAARDPVPLAAYPNITFQGDLDQRLVLLGEPIVVEGSMAGPMRVAVRLRNATDNTVWVQYRFRFYGPGRDPVDVDMPWRSQSIQPTLAADFGANSLQAGATEWELEVRPQ